MTDGERPPGRNAHAPAITHRRRPAGAADRLLRWRSAPESRNVGPAPEARRRRVRVKSGSRHEWKGHAAVKFCTDPKAQHQLVTHERTVVARVMKHGGKHPNIVPLLECNLSGEIPWLMYRVCRGRHPGRSRRRVAQAIAAQAAWRAVRVLHTITTRSGMFHRLEPPLIHRDLKPQNILMASGGHALFPASPTSASAGRPCKRFASTTRIPARLWPLRCRRSCKPRVVRDTLRRNSDSAAHQAPATMFTPSVSLRINSFFGDLDADPGFDASSELRALRIPAEFDFTHRGRPRLTPDPAAEGRHGVGSATRRSLAAENRREWHPREVRRIRGRTDGGTQRDQ